MYGRLEFFYFSVLDHIEQHEVRHELGGDPTRDEARGAVKKLNVSSPGGSGVSAVAVKALIEHGLGAGLLFEVVS